MIDLPDIPASWTRICGLSLDRTHAGAVWLAHDRKDKIISLYGEYSVTLPALPILADALCLRCGRDEDGSAWIPVITDLEAFKRTKQEGAVLGGRLVDLGVPLNDARYDDEAGLEETRKALLIGRLTIQPTARRWLAEFDTFARDDATGKLPEKGFHLMRATGLALMLEPEEWISENRARSDRAGPGAEQGDRTRNPVTGY